MSKFDELIPKILEYGGNPKRLTPSEVKQLRSEYPDLPNDYFAFLEEIGYGSLGGMHMYSGPIPASELRGAADLENVLLFGDTEGEFFFGFDTKDGHRPVVFDSDLEVFPSGRETFLEVMRNWLLD